MYPWYNIFMKRQGTVCFIINDNEILLILMEYSPTDRKWTGIGGMVDAGESLEDSLIREIDEESYIKIEKKDMRKVAEIEYPGFQLNVFLTDKSTGKLRAKEAMLKEFRWFSKDDLPYSDMHAGNDKWLPQILEGKFIKLSNNELIEVADFGA